VLTCPGRGPASPAAPGRGPARRPLPHEARGEGARLAQRFEEGDADGVGEVERADGAEGRDADDAVRVGGEEVVGEADALAPEDERVAGGEAGVEVAPRADRAEEVEAPSRRLGGERGEERREVVVAPHVDEVPVVDAGAAHAVLVDAEAELPDEV